jgi:hypothetical protein
MTSSVLREWLMTPLVERVLRARSEVVLSQRVRSRPLSKWDKFIPPDLHVVREVVTEFENEGVTRSHLLDFAASALESDSDNDYLRLFMVVQLWGVGRSGRMHHTGSTLAQPGVVEQFRQLAHAVRDGDPTSATGHWAEGWRTSFTTKFAYAVALAIDPAAPSALIFDERVKTTLRRLGWQWPESGDGDTERRGYAGYLGELHSTADEMSIRPDAIEWLLFDPTVDLIALPHFPADTLP